MKPWLKLCWQGSRFCAECLAHFCLWSLWLVLLVLLGLQIYIVSSRELTLPAFVRRDFEHRLAASQVRMEFGRTSFDPTGQVLIKDARLFLPNFAEPVATVESVYVSLEPWALLVGRFEPRTLRVSGARLSVAAMLSPTGRSEPLLHDLNLTLVPGPHGFELSQLTGRLSTLRFSAHGAIQTAPLRRGRGQPLPIPEMLARSYPAICRQLVALTAELSRLESPSLELVLAPSETRGAIVEATLLASGLKLAAPLPLTATGLRATTRVPLLRDSSSITRLEVSADSAQSDRGFRAAGLHALIRGRLGADFRRFDFQRAELTAARVSGAGLTTGPLVLEAGGPLTALEGELTTRILDEALTVQGRVDLTAGRAELRTAGRFDPDLLGLIGRRLRLDLRRFIDFKSAPAFDLNVNFAPGWQFTGLHGHIAGDDAMAYQVPMDAFAGDIAFDGRRFKATRAVAHIGDHFARGSFEQDFATREFRFLLTGRLNPPAINGWFSDWWDNFWTQFDFAAAAPEADVDVRGRWGRGPETTVYVFADCVQPVIRGVALDHAITRLFIRPHFFDVFETFATKGAGAARGRFSRRHAYPGHVLESMDFDFDSTLELPDAAALVGPELSETLRPFVFTTTPAVQVAGRIDGPASPRGVHRDIRIKGHATGAFTLYGFPLRHLDFEAALQDDVLRIAPVTAGFAEGQVSGHVRLSGPEANRRLGFALSLRDGSLREAATALEAYSARRRGVAPAANSQYIEGTAQVRMALDLEAEGDAADPYSFTGNGRAELGGQGLGRIRLLGLLSELLNFTALRFDTLRTDFTIARDSLIFPHVNLTGPDAAITARGAYRLDRRELDFYARVFPFQESSFILKSVVGLVLSPISGVLEVKLTGQLDKPEWAFVIGPTNFLRSLFASPDREQNPSSPPPEFAPPPAR